MLHVFGVPYGLVLCTCRRESRLLVCNGVWGNDFSGLSAIAVFSVMGLT